MKLLSRNVCLASCLFLVLTSGFANATDSSRTVVHSADGRHQLIRAGQPYFVQGAGGHTNLAELAAAGGNSIRTWGTDGLDEILDEALRHGLTVTVGLWLGHERHGFDYQDQAAVVRRE